MHLSIYFFPTLCAFLQKCDLQVADVYEDCHILEKILSKAHLNYFFPLQLLSEDVPKTVADI